MRQAAKKYDFESRGKKSRPRRPERDLSDGALDEEIELAAGNPERKTWLRQLRAEKKRRGLA